MMSFRSSSSSPLLLLVFLLLVIIGAVAVAHARDSRPIIGILTQPTRKEPNALGASYLAASYVKWVESSGARVVPVRYELGAEYLSRTFRSVNGLLFPGGGTDLDHSHPFMQAATLLYNLVLKENQAGRVFPLWGTCQGFQMIAILGSQQQDFKLDPTDAMNISLPLDLLKAASFSRMFRGMTRTMLHEIGNEPLTMNNHHWGVFNSTWRAQHALTTQFTPLSTNLDRLGKMFISSFEHQQYPIFASQFHPEKNPFEWTPIEDINHSRNGVSMSQFFAGVLVHYARMNNHTYSDHKTELQALIYSQPPPIYTEPLNDFTQTYYWQ